MTKPYFLIDRTHNKEYIYKMKVCAMASELALTHGRNLTEELISKYWNHEEFPPSPRTVLDLASTKNIKWYIRNFISVQDRVWNADFLRGITQYGWITERTKNFPSFHFYSNIEIEKMFDSCPFYGEKSNNWTKRKLKLFWYSWLFCPALLLKHSDKSVSFLAGVLSTARVHYIKNEKTTYAKFPIKMLSLIEGFHIPIEIKGIKFFYISPFWVTLLTPWMPECCKKWEKVKNPYKAEEYALIMWRIFTGKDIATNGIPHLISRRMYYYRYHTIKGLEKKWVDNKLTQIDSRYKDVIKYWEERNKNNV